MQQDNNLKNKLQQVDKQQLSDLSQMDKHWQQMQVSLQHVAAPKKGLTVKAPFFITVAAVIILAVIFYNQFSQKENEKIIAVPGKLPVTITTEQNNFTDTTLVKKKTVAANTTVTPKKAKSISLKNSFSKNPTHHPLAKLQATDSNINKVQKPQPAEAVINKKQLLENLQDQLKKTANEYVINNSKDTLLDCREGSSLLIPANSLGGGEVIISVTEFYKKSEMVLNQLTTTSDGNLLESGGMLHIEASRNGIPIKERLKNPIKFYLADTSSKLQTMQLFTGEEKQSIIKNSQGRDTIPTTLFRNNINWKANPQYFNRVSTVTEVKVLDLRNEPFKTIKRRKGVVAVFNVVSKPQMSRAELKRTLKEKYGYYKVRFGFRENSFFHGRLPSKIDSITYSDIPIGDSIWVDKTVADKYKLGYSATRTYQVTRSTFNANTEVRNLMSMLDYALLEKIKDHYSVDINSLGWINCDRFNYDPGQKITYTVDLGDNAETYHTFMIFDRIKSMISGTIAGNTVIFKNMPLGDPVKIISIGIDKKGQPVVAMRSVNIENRLPLTLEFEQTSAPNIKSSLGKLDE